MRRLPPLTAIEAFVQVARLGSIKAAAQELALSPPALSRRVQALERFIGKPLFERRHQALVLNMDGERLLAQIAPAIDSLSDAVETMTSGTEVLRLRLGILPLFASQRLFPKLGDLRAKHPELHLDIDTAGHFVVAAGRRARCGDRLAREIDPALYARRLDRNLVYVIGAKSLLEGPTRSCGPTSSPGLPRSAPRHARHVQRVAQGGGTARSRTAGDRSFRFGAADARGGRAGAGHRFHARIAFRGCARRPARAAVRYRGRSPYSYWFVCRPRALTQKPVRLFHDWLIQAVVEE